jgi:hypothetical protein
MKVEKNRTIGGAPLIKVRDLLRYIARIVDHDMS